MKTLIHGGSIVNEGRIARAAIIIANDTIEDIIWNNDATDASRDNFDAIVDATGCFVLPGVIDTHVHFREPGLTHKASIETESRAAAYGGVTSYLEMPNTVPQTTTLENLNDKYERACQSSHINYAFFYGATNDNAQTFSQLDQQHIPGIKLFMGSSTGNMLVDRREALQTIFQTATELGLPVMAHCEDTDIINRNMAAAKQQYGEDPPIYMHPVIRSEEACYASTRLATSLAKDYGTRLHVAHVSTAKELELFGASENITAEAVVAHLLFSDRDYESLGNRIKCNPAIKQPADRDALRQALANGLVSTVATDHAPHLWEEKQGGCSTAASGMPMIQFSLPAMLGLVDEGLITMERLVELMAHEPARLFGIRQRGFIRKSYKADLAIVRPNSPWTVTPDCIQSRCRWSPLEGHTLSWRVEKTCCNGRLIYDSHREVPFEDTCRGEELSFQH